MKSIQLKCLHPSCRGAPLRQTKLANATAADVYRIRSVSRLRANTSQLVQKRFFGYPHNMRKFTPEQLAEYSARVEDWLQEAKAEPYGNYRGNQPVLRRLYEQAADIASKIPGFLDLVPKIHPEKVWIKLEQVFCKMPSKPWAHNEMFAEHTPQPIIRLDDTQSVLLELWRSGSRYIFNIKRKENQHGRKRRKRKGASRRYFPYDKKLYQHLLEKYQKELDKKVAERDRITTAWKDQWWSDF
jgi:hypothetical protein